MYYKQIKMNKSTWYYKQMKLIKVQGTININTVDCSNNHLLNLGGDFPRAGQPGKLFCATGLEIIFAVLLSFGIMLGSLAVSITDDRDVRPQAPC